MEDLRTIYRLLHADGTGQSDRLGAALADGYVQLEDRDAAAMVALLYALARKLIFFNNDGTISGDWTALFRPFFNNAIPDTLQDHTTITEILRTAQNVAPHLALLLAFLQLLHESRQSLNALSRQHQEFYYRDVLQLPLRKGMVDSVHVLFALNKNAPTQLLPAGTLLDGGKSPDGPALVYRTLHDVVLNHSRTAAMYSLFVENIKKDNSRLLWSAAYDPAALPGDILPFGSPQQGLTATDHTMQPATIGLGFSSGLLKLQGGVRRILITIQSAPYIEDAPALSDLKNVLQAELTGEKGWVKPSLIKAVIRRDKVNTKLAVFELELLLSEALPGITSHRQDIHHTRFPEGVPALRLTNRTGIAMPKTLTDFKISTVTTEVSVTGLKQLVLQSEEGVQSSARPIQVFGPVPAIGSRFYIGSAECFSKNLQQLVLQLQWHDLPPDLVKHYKGYTLPDNFNHAVFNMDVDLLLDGTFEGHSLKQEIQLFEDDNSFKLIMPSGPNDSTPLPLQRSEELPDLSDGYAPGIERGFIRLTLMNPVYPGFSAFGHNNYNNALLQATRKMLAQPGTVVDMPQAPYTPQAKEITLDYIARDTVFPGSHDRLYHMLPLGIQQLQEAGSPLFPHLAATGYFFLGIADLQPQQQVNLLLNLAENNATDFEGYEAAVSKPEIDWFYLAGNNWVQLLPDQIPVDTTQNLQRSGMLTLQPGHDATTEHLLMPPGMIWLQAVLYQGLNLVPPLHGIHTQAVEAVLDLPAPLQPSDVVRHLATGLPAGTITQSINAIPDLKSIQQPYPSFGGIPPEEPEAYITRISERLRHRKRLVHPWDVERMGLEAFPEISKIKCVGGKEVELPGITKVVVITRIDPAQPLAKRLQPRGGKFFLEKVRQHLISRVPAFTEIQVNNPDYEEVLADFKVKFRAGLDPAFYLAQLNEALVRFLSPWVYDDKTTLFFDREIYRSELIYFIEKLDYVDYVTDFKLFRLYATGIISNGPGLGKMKIGKDFIVAQRQHPNIGTMTIGDTFVVGVEWEVITASKATAVLVSAAQHTISVVDTVKPLTVLGIGDMTVGFDFVVSISA